MKRILLFGFLLILVSVSVLGSPDNEAWGKEAVRPTRRSQRRGRRDTAITAGGEAVSGMGEAAVEGLSQSASPIGS